MNKPTACLLQALALAALLAPIPSAQDSIVLSGLDVLDLENFMRIDGARVGLITNSNCRSRHGERTIDTLHRASNVILVKIFSPEHGPGGSAEGKVEHSVDQKTKLPIYSLYGETRKPDDAMLDDIDTLVFDLQDVGCRYYTYASTLVLSMQAAADRGHRFVVLDRPNPLGGTAVAGPVLDRGRESFTGMYPVPIIHGMTIGEYAALINREFEINADLHVVAMRNWKRGMAYDQTGMHWLNPSPNIRSLSQALLYPGVGLLEFTNISVGRGTATPFELVGAPWIDGNRLVRLLRTSAPPGVSFVPRRFTPTTSKHAGVACDGVQILITDRKVFEPITLGLHLACALRDLYRRQWKLDAVDRLLCDESVLTALQKGASPEEMKALWTNELAAFVKRREHWLTYKD